MTARLWCGASDDHGPHEHQHWHCPGAGYLAEDYPRDRPQATTTTTRAPKWWQRVDGRAVAVAGLLVLAGDHLSMRRRIRQLESR